MSDSFAYLIEWFRVHCDDDWEHGEGITLETLDNPGWALEVTLSGTELEGVTVGWVKDEVDDDQTWLHWRSTGYKFMAACGVNDLPRALDAFREFAESNGSGLG